MEKLNSISMRLINALQDSKLPVFISTGTYFLGFILGIFLSYSSIKRNFELPIIGENVLILQNSPTFGFIIGNNVKLVLVLISGSFLFGFTTFMNLIFNGLFFGGILTEYIKEISLTKAILLTAPHAIFELPAILIAGAAGFKIPYELLRYLNGKKNYAVKRKEIMDFLILVCFSIFLIFIAALVESYITIIFLK